MKLLFDQNISYKLVKKFRDTFTDSNHVYLLDLDTASDNAVWDYARKNNFTIVTQDSDFNERSILYGFPPKVIWLRTGNSSSQYLSNLIGIHLKDIQRFEHDQSSGCLIITACS